MPMGLKNSGATFQSFMNFIFRDCLNRFVIVYIDDILVYSQSVREHAGHLETVTGILAKVGLKIND